MSCQLSFVTCIEKCFIDIKKCNFLLITCRKYDMICFRILDCMRNSLFSRELYFGNNFTFKIIIYHHLQIFIFFVFLIFAIFVIFVILVILFIFVIFVIFFIFVIFLVDGHQIYFSLLNIYFSLLNNC